MDNSIHHHDCRLPATQFDHDTVESVNSGAIKQMEPAEKRNLEREIMTYVVHVRGNAERFDHMQKLLATIGLPHEYILDGNKEDLTESTLEASFCGDLKRSSAATSCVHKHLLACRRVVASGLQRALILEDDIMTLPPYSAIFPQCLAEMKVRGLVNCIISLENSGHNFVKRSDRTSGTLLYPQKHGRCAGAYIIDAAGAQTLLDYVQKHKIGTAIDTYHNRLLQENRIACYWLEPPVFEQASNSGRMMSLLEEHKKERALKRFTHDIRRGFRRMVSHLR